MALWGTLVNAAAIVAGSILGLLIPRLRESIRSTVMQGIGLAVIVLGMTMAVKSNNFLIPIASLVIGGIIGELIGVEKGLQYIGNRLERIVPSKGEGRVASAFVTTTLIYCVGAMAILGAMDSGIRGNHDILYTKSMLDGFSSIIFTSTLGVGVIFSAIPVLLYQGAIALASTYIDVIIGPELLEAVIAEITAVGGVLIIGIGLNVLEIKKINVANLLPSLAVAVGAVYLMQWIG
jgi:uncharacterized protein